MSYTLSATPLSFVFDALHSSRHSSRGDSRQSSRQIDCEYKRLETLCQTVEEIGRSHFGQLAALGCPSIGLIFHAARSSPVDLPCLRFRLEDFLPYEAQEYISSQLVAQLTKLVQDHAETLPREGDGLVIDVQILQDK